MTQIDTSYFKSIDFLIEIAKMYSCEYGYNYCYLMRKVINCFLQKRNIQCYNANIFGEIKDSITNNLKIKLTSNKEFYKITESDTIEIKLKYANDFISIDLNETYKFKREGRKFFINDIYIGYCMKKHKESDKYYDWIYNQEEPPKEVDCTNLETCATQILELLDKYNCKFCYDEDGVWLRYENDPYNNNVTLV